MKRTIILLKFDDTREKNVECMRFTKEKDDVSIVTDVMPELADDLRLMGIYDGKKGKRVKPTDDPDRFMDLLFAEFGHSSRMSVQELPT
jgi:hypothetical protein